MGHGSEDHKCQKYRIRVMKTGSTITRTKRHLKPTPISVEDYMRKEILKTNRQQTDDKLNDLIDCFAQIN